MTHRERLLLIGHPVSHSLSPVMHAAALGAAGLSVRYETLDVSAEDLAATFQRLARVSCAGNVTLPHKVMAMDSMAECSEVARRVGAVNTFWRDNRGRLIGDNTDVEGFAAMTTALLGGAPSKARFAVIGSGGAAAAVLAAIQQWPGCTATIHARNATRAQELQRRFSVVSRAASMTDSSIEASDIVVNATPIGLVGDEQPVDVSRLSPDAVVLDLVYRRSETRWVRAARSAGRRASDGLSMLLHQGAASFSRWFGVEPDRTVMWNALREATGR